MGILFYFVGTKLMLPLSFPRFDPRSRWRSGVIAGLGSCWFVFDFRRCEGVRARHGSAARLRTAGLARGPGCPREGTVRWSESARGTAPSLGSPTPEE